LAVVLFVVTYLLWCRFSPPPVRHGQIVAAKTSPKIVDMERKAVTPAKVMVFTPKANAVHKLKLPETEAANDKEEVFEATDAPASRHGTTTTTFINMSSGMPRSVIQVKKSPWFSFERGNRVGIEYGIGSHGNYYQGDYTRDVLQVKGVYVSGHMATTVYRSEADFRVGVRAEYRW
jgi:hypothetical protein